MKKKILIALLILMLPTFVIINSIANNSNEQDHNISVEVNNDIMINSPLFTKKESDVTYTQPEVNMIMDEFELVTTKGDLSLYVNETTGALRVQNNITKFVWASDVLNFADYSADLNKDRKAQLRTPFVVNYFNSKNNENEVYSTSSGVDFKVKTNSSGFNYEVTVKASSDSIKFKIEVVLSENGINVNIPHQDIVEKGEIKLKSIAVLPNMGAAYGSTVSGYIFVPSGNGGLIRYESKPAINSTYSQLYYGSDANRMSTAKNVENNSLTIPVFGIAHGVGKNAVVATINSGSSFATFNYEPSSLSSGQVTSQSLGTKNGFHRVYNTFTYRENYTLTINGNPITMIPDNIYAQDISMTYQFLENEAADYVGMAKAYQEQLVARKVLHKNSNSGSTNVHIDVLGGETEKGIVLDKFVKMTTTAQLLEINAELTKKFSNKFTYTLRGFNKNGYSRQTASNYKFDGRLGSLKDLDGLDYYMYYNPVESYNSNDSADNTKLVNVFNQQFSVTMEEGKKYKHYSNVETVTKGVEKANSAYHNTLAVDGLNRLYGDHNNELERYQVMDIYANYFDDTLPMFKPHEYMFANTSHYFNMSLYHDRSRFITDSVPFLQIAMRGYIDYYSTYINFSTNQEIDVLKCIEYGSNLAYLISAEESYLISNTLSNHLYATHYESNKKIMYEQINKVNVVLNQIKAQEIEGRYVIENGVVEVTYANGIKVYVNYTNDTYTYGDIKIPSMDYKVVS